MFGWLGTLLGRGADEDGLLSQIEKALVTLIPARVAALAVREPVYCLRIWYHGSDTDSDRTPSLMLVKEAARRRLLVERGHDGADAIWFADELTYPDWSVSAELDDRRLARLCRRWYTLRLGRDLPDEEEELGPVRSVTQRVAARLNRLDWTTLTSATDDFVVFPADSSHTFCDDYGDMRASVPAPKIELLRSRGLLGAGFDWPDDEADEAESGDSHGSE